MKLSRHIYLPAILVVYLAVMAYITYDGVESGEVSMAAYIATFAGSLCAVVVLFFALRRREKLRREREEDIRRNKGNIG